MQYIKIVTIYLLTKLQLPNPALFLSTEAEFLSKNLYCRHLVAYYSVNMKPKLEFQVSPLSTTT